ncbi:MAG: COG1361 S-layer family protein [Methanosarcinales archaeon]|jgi:hypothetical protein|nr:COG1361 S-layer family protein [Methanosarcinales archaeon]
MSKKIFKSALRLFVAAMLLLSIFSGVSSAAVGLKITLVDQTPYPAQPGQQIRFWIQAENIGDGTLNDVTIQVVSDGVFSASSSESSKNYDNIYAGTKVYHEFIMYVASDAPDGPRELTVRYRTNNTTIWVEEKFTVNIGGIVDTNNRGTLIIENVSATPEVFMPGDEGIIWVTLKNNATNQTVSTSDRSVYMTNARIQSADLYSKDNIIVRSEAVNDLGLIAPGDTIRIPFRISIPEDTPADTYLLTLNITGSSYEYNIKRNIEIKVDSSGIKAIQSKAAVMGASGKTIEIDIVNYHQGTLRGVSIVPAAEGMSFYPTEYFIGEMKPDDLYTAKFNITQSGAPSDSKNGSGGSDVEFKAVYYNGDNSHEDSVTLDVGSMAPAQSSGGIFTYAVYLIILLLIAAVAGHFYLKKKRDMSLIGWMKVQKANIQAKRAAKKGKKQT